MALNYKIRTRGKLIPSTGKPGNWVLWAGFCEPQSQHIYADSLRAQYPHWDVQEYTGSLEELEPVSGLEAQVVSVNSYAPNVSGYDYENQAWVVDGRYQSCGHQESNCGCYGKIHAGQPVAPNAMIH